jgi:hypothetical protein
LAQLSCRCFGRRGGLVRLLCFHKMRSIRVSGFSVKSDAVYNPCVNEGIGTPFIFCLWAPIFGATANVGSCRGGR